MPRKTASSKQKLPQPILEQPQQIIDHQAYMIIDRMDEEAIMQNMQGRMTENLCYSFQVTDKRAEGGKRYIEGVGWRGAMTIARETKGLGADPNVKPVGDVRNDIMYVMVYCRDEINQVGVWGSGWQKLHMKRWNRDLKRDEVVEDPFAFVKAMNKAQRNGILALIDEGMKKKFIERWKTEGKVTKFDKLPPGTQAPPTQQTTTPVPAGNKEPAPQAQGKEKTSLFA